MDVAVVGGSFAGLLAGVQLARAGREVVVVEQDLPALLAPPGDAPRAPRRGAPHTVHGHAMLARCVMEMRARVPDVVDELTSRGGIEHRLPEHFPPSAGSTAAVEGDDELVMLFCRRHVLDRVLLDVAAATAGLELREGRVSGLELRPATHSGPLRAAGVQLESGELLRAPMVLDAGGRRSRVPALAAAAAAAPTTEVVEHDCPLVYYSRHYRFLGLRRPPLNRLFASGGFLPGGLGLMWFPGDADTAILAVVAHARDELARRMTDPEVLTALARAVPTVEPWIAESEPISPVFVVSAARSSLRRRPDTEARVLGVHHLGDSLCHTNPTLGRGLSFAAAHANRLVDAILQHPDDADLQMNVIEAWTTGEIWPRFLENVGYDRALAASFLADIAQEPPPVPPPPADGAVTVAELMAAGMTDAALLRKATRMMQLLDGLDALHDPGVVAAVRERVPAGFTPPPIAGPTRGELADLVARSR